jgi:hypothetical protein
VSALGVFFGSYCTNSITFSLNAKEISFWVIGLLTLVYCVIELGVALYEDSLTLLSDGFHNLSDVISLYIAFWASKVNYTPTVPTLRLTTEYITNTYHSRLLDEERVMKCPTDGQEQKFLEL